MLKLCIYESETSEKGSTNNRDYEKETVINMQLIVHWLTMT